MAILRRPDRRGSFIALYGASNLGKSTQLKHLAAKLAKEGHQSFMIIKFPIYQLHPTGPKLNEILRQKNRDKVDVKSIEMQKLYAENRMDFQSVLIELLNSGIDVIAEDYTGTGIAWGLTWGLALRDLEFVNFGFITPDYTILFDGNRYKKAIEKGHKYEDTPDRVWEKNRYEHLFLAERYDWDIVNANDKPEKVHQNVWEIVKPAFGHMHKDK